MMDGAKSKGSKADKKTGQITEKPLTRLSGSSVLFTHKDLETIEAEARKKRSSLKKSSSESSVGASKKVKPKKNPYTLLRPSRLQIGAPTSTESSSGTTVESSKQKGEKEKGGQTAQLTTPLQSPVSDPGVTFDLLSPVSQYTFTGLTQGTSDFKTCASTAGQEPLAQQLQRASQGLSLPKESNLGDTSGQLDSFLLCSDPQQVRDNTAFLEKISERTLEGSLLASTSETSPVSTQRPSLPLLSGHLGTEAFGSPPKGDQNFCTSTGIREPEQDRPALIEAPVQQSQNTVESDQGSSLAHPVRTEPIDNSVQSASLRQTEMSTQEGNTPPEDHQEATHAVKWLQDNYGLDASGIPKGKTIALRSSGVKRTLAAQKVIDYTKDFHGKLKTIRETLADKKVIPKADILAGREVAKLGRNLLSELDKSNTEVLEVLTTYKPEVPNSDAISNHLGKEVQTLRDDWLKEYAAFEKLNVESERQEEQISSAQSKLPATSLKPPFDGTSYRNYPVWRERVETMIISKPNLADTLKMQYILDALAGKAKESVAQFNILPGELTKLMDYLDSRYGDKQKLRQLFSKDLLSLPPLDNSASVSKVRDFIDKLAISARLAQKYDFKISPSMVQDILFPKLPVWYRREMSRKLPAAGVLEYDDFIKIITGILEQEEQLTPYQQGPSMGPVSSGPGNGPNQSNGAKAKKAKPPAQVGITTSNVNALTKKTSNSPPPKPPFKKKMQQQPAKSTPKPASLQADQRVTNICRFCTNNHEEGDCPQFHAKNLAGRRLLAAKFGICFSCMRASCLGRNRCNRKDRKCYAIQPDNSICIKNHHPLLHQNVPFDQ